MSIPFSQQSARTFTFLFLVPLLLSLSSNAQVDVISHRFPPEQTSQVAYGNGVYVAVGNGALMVSSDGMHFTNDYILTPSMTIHGDQWSGVSFANGLFVAVGIGFATSTDGVHWAYQPFPPIVPPEQSDPGEGAIGFYGGQWIVSGILFYGPQDVGFRSYYLASSDGLHWGVLDLADSDYAEPDQIFFFNNTYVISEQAPHGGLAIYTSATAASGSWKLDTAINSRFGPNLIRYELANNRLFVFTRDTVYTSTDGNNWMVLFSDNIQNYDLQNVQYVAPYYYFFAGAGGLKSSNLVDFTPYSINGIGVATIPLAKLNDLYYSWFNLAWSTGDSNWHYLGGEYTGVAKSKDLYVVTSSSYPRESIFTSPDGAVWTQKLLNCPAPLLDITYANGMFVATSDVEQVTQNVNMSYIMTSPDGTDWTRNSFPDLSLGHVAGGDGVFVAARGYHSTDAKIWTAPAVGPVASTTVAFLNHYFIITGHRTYDTVVNGKAAISLSSDGGNHWTDVSPNFDGYVDGISYGNGKYVIVGRTTSADSLHRLQFYSATTTDITDPSAWSAPSFDLSAVVAKPDSLTITRVTYGDGWFVAVGSSNERLSQTYVLSSQDGIHWDANAPKQQFSQLSDIVYDSVGAFKAVGAHATIVDISVGSPLPLTLLSFTGQHAGDGNVLSWKTSNEVNTKQFIIEYSPIADRFVPIGTVAAAGMASTTEDYHYTHTPAPAGNDFYRLKMVDADGRFTYSNIVEVSAPSWDGVIMIWPNPTSDGQVNIGVPSNVTLPLAYAVFTALGGKVAGGVITGSSQTLDMSGLSHGVYTIWFGNGEVRKVIRK